jgi:hypothetical protein
MMGKKLNLTGRKFGSLNVLSEAGKNKQGKFLWKCLCDCGKETIVAGASLVTGNTKSCGCRAHDKPHHYTHGLSSERLYNIYRCMKARCYNKKHRSYLRYGGRGIIVCDEWLNDINAFFAWAMSHGYRDNLTIDRKNVNGNYEPSNCRWATNEFQQSNTRKNVWLEINGEKHTISQWSRLSNIPITTIRGRIKNGLLGEKLIQKKRL